MPPRRAAAAAFIFASFVGDDKEISVKKLDHRSKERWVPLVFRDYEVIPAME